MDFVVPAVPIHLHVPIILSCNSLQPMSSNPDLMSNFVKGEEESGLPSSQADCIQS